MYGCICVTLTKLCEYIGVLSNAVQLMNSLKGGGIWEKTKEL